MLVKLKQEKEKKEKYMSEKLRQSKLIKLHMQSMDHLLEVQGDAEESKVEVDTELLYT